MHRFRRAPAPKLETPDGRDATQEATKTSLEPPIVRNRRPARTRFTRALLNARNFAMALNAAAGFCEKAWRWLSGWGLV